MSEQLLTKCPHCSTTFRLSQQQLETAGGAVRCGACYQVFHAREHIVDTPETEETTQETPEGTPDPFIEFEANQEKTSTSEPFTSQEWNQNEHPDADLFSEDYHERNEQPEVTSESPSAIGSNNKKNQNNVDEAWAEKLLSDLEEETNEDSVPDLIEDNPAEDNDHRSNTGFTSITSSESVFSEDPADFAAEDNSNELSNSFAELDNWNSNNLFAADNGDTLNAGEGAADESWAQAMLSELEQDPTPEVNLDQLEIVQPAEEADDNPFATKNLANDIPVIKKRKKKQEKQKKSESDKKDDRSFDSEDYFSQLAPEHDIDDIELGEMPNLLEDELAIEGLLQDSLSPSTQDILANQITASAAHFGIEEDAASRSLVKSAAWALTNLLVIAMLCGQYAYFQYDNLARNETYRPFFKTFCEKAGCILPLKSDISQIRGTNLVVRSHAMEKNALVIDAIAYNRAPFSQPFPIIELRFDDINGNPVASRRFQPAEYIHDDSIDLNNMPSDTPVHLTLEIVDPGNNAVNYQMKFYATEQPSI